MDGEDTTSSSQATHEKEEEYDESIPDALFSVGYPLVAMFNFLAASTSLFFFFSMILSRKMRTNPYNFYIIWLIFPDAFNTICVGLKLAFLGANKEVLMPFGFCETRVFVFFFYFTANFYLNAVVAYEIQKLVNASYNRKKVPPPTMKKVYKQVGAVYAFAIFGGFWAASPVPWSFLNIADGPRGKILTGSPPGGFFSEKAATMIMYFFLIVPTAYVLFVRIRIAVKKLLPMKGRTRVLSLFFMRILIVFFVFYFPSSFLTRAFVASSDYSTAYYSAELIIGVLASGQAAVTLYMISLKDDIRKVVHEALPSFLQPFCCRKISNDAQGKTAVTGLSRPNKTSSNTGTLVPENPSLASSESQTMRSEWEEDDVYEADVEPTQEMEDNEFDPYGSEDIEQPAGTEARSHSPATTSPQTTLHTSVDMTGGINEDVQR